MNVVVQLILNNFPNVAQGGFLLPLQKRKQLHGEKCKMIRYDKLKLF